VKTIENCKNRLEAIAKAGQAAEVEPPAGQPTEPTAEVEPPPGQAAEAGQTVADAGQAAGAGQLAGQDADAGQAVAEEPESKRQRLEEDEDSPNDAPPAGLQVAEESDGYETEDDPEVLVRLIAEAQEEKVRLKMILDDPTISPEVRRDTVRLHGVAVSDIRECEYTLRGLPSKL
jgi:hypothetical protein